MSLKEIAKKSKIRELIIEVKSGNQAAFDRLLVQYEPMIRATVNQFTKGTLDTEDLRQEALTVFYRAIMTFNVEQYEVNFGLYAKICVTNALISQVRSARRRAMNAVASLEYNEYFRYGSTASYDPAGQVIEQENEKALLAFIERNLSEYENRVWFMYISGLTSSEISGKLSRTEKSIDNALYRIKRKLRSLLEK